MRITEIKKGKGGCWHLFIDGEYYASFSNNLLLEAGWRVGTECTQDQLLKLKQLSDCKRAKERALYLLEYRDHSRKELVQKLCKIFSKEIAEQTADKMEQLGFLDDWAYAQKLAQKFVIEKNRGNRRALFEMQQKGLEKDMAMQAIEQLEVDPIVQLKKIIQKKYSAKLNGDKAIEHKVIAALARMGYCYDDIRFALNEMYFEWDEGTNA